MTDETVPPRRWIPPAPDAEIVFLGDPKFERSVWTPPTGTVLHRDGAASCPFHPDRAQVRNGMCGPCAEKADDAL